MLSQRIKQVGLTVVGLCSLVVASPAHAVVQATTIGTFWSNDLNGGEFITKQDFANATGPGDFKASVSDSYTEGGFTFTYDAAASFETGLIQLDAGASSTSGAIGTIERKIGSGIPQTLSRIQEEIIFTPPNSNPYTVSATMFVSGSFSTTADPEDLFAVANLFLSGRNLFESDSFRIDQSSSPTSQLLTVEATLRGPQTVTLQGELGANILEITGPDQLIDFSFGNSAQLGISVTNDVPFTSGSGVFLSVIPEPGSVALFGAGLLAIGSRGRAQRG